MKKRNVISFFTLLALLLSLLTTSLAVDGVPSGIPEDTGGIEIPELDPGSIEPAADDVSAADGGEPAAEGGSGADGSGSYVVPGQSYTVKAKSAILIEMNTNQILLEQDADRQVYPASLTKVMTCMLTLEHGTLSDQITVSETAMEGLSEAGSTAGLQPGETLTLEELLYCMMLSSANEACNIAAEYVAGSVDAFVEMMNTRASELGCTGTHFANPHGLHDENHYTTARDLSLIVREALKNETFRTITSTVTHTVPPTNLSGERKLQTTNELVTPGRKYYYEKATGVKTGFTTPAGLCLISTADNGKLKLLSVLCGADYVFDENGEQTNENFTETKALFEWGFDNFAFAKVLTTLYPITQIPVLSSAGPESSLLAPEHELTALLPADFDESLIRQEFTYSSPDGVEAPIQKGQKLGTVTVYYQDHNLGTCNLVAITDIAKSEIAASAESTKSFFRDSWWKLLLLIPIVLLVLWIVMAVVRRSRRRRRRRQQRQRQQQGEIIDLRDRRRDRED